MEVNNPQIRRLILWNRIWLVLVGFYGISLLCNFTYEKIIYDAVRLHLSCGYDENGHGDGSLEFSLNQGGPFVVTHLATTPPGTPGSAIAALPEPLLISSHKSQISISRSEISKLKWIDVSGNRIKPPKLGEQLTAIYYKCDQLTAKSSHD